jgi:hypothetical protein
MGQELRIAAAEGIFGIPSNGPSWLVPAAIGVAFAAGASGVERGWDQDSPRAVAIPSEGGAHRILGKHAPGFRQAQIFCAGFGEPWFCSEFLSLFGHPPVTSRALFAPFPVVFHLLTPLIDEAPALSVNDLQLA